MTRGFFKDAKSVLIVAAFVYAVAVFVLLAAVIEADPFILFSVNYMVLSFIALPIVWVFFSILFARRLGRLPFGWLACHLVVVAMVTFGHFWIMVQFAAGV